MADRVFAALGDPVRRAMISLLAEGEQSAGGIVAALRVSRPISQPAVSQHLKVLREAGLATVRAEGNRRFYSLDAAGVDVVREWLDGLAARATVFTQPLDALATEVARGRRARRRSTGGPDRKATGYDRPA